MIRTLFSRIGCLILFFGTIVLIVGFVIAQSEETPMNQYLIGSAMIVIGFILYARMRGSASKNKRKPFSTRRERHSPQKEDHPWENQFDDKTNFVE